MEKCTLIIVVSYLLFVFKDIIEIMQIFREQQIKEDYEEWKRNAVYLYSFG